MNPVKVEVYQVKNPSGMVCLASVKDAKITDDFTIKKDKVFFSVTPEIYKQMKKPKSVAVQLMNKFLYVNPVI